LLGRWSDSSGRTPASMRSPEFKPQYHQKKEKKKKESLIVEKKGK
jgi:hypothetical protein